MGFVGFLEFALTCVHILAWPLVSLGYPLHASIQAIESNSNSGMRNLVAYWIISSLISFFELAFGKLLEWLPFWFYIKLMTICLLVLPNFEGACFVYEHLVRPCFSFNPEVVVKQLVKPKKDLSLNAESFLAAAEKYVKENGSEALEKLIAGKSIDTKSNIDVEVIKAVTNSEKNETAATIQSDFKKHSGAKQCAEELELTRKSPADDTKVLKSKEPIVAEDAKADQLKEKNPAPATEEVRCVESNLAHSGTKATAAGKIKCETMVSQDKVGEIPPLEKVQKEWTCAVCQVITTSEQTLNYHLQGRKHKASCERLALSKQEAKNKGSSSTPNQEPKKSDSGDRVNQRQTKEQDKLHSVDTGNQKKTMKQKAKAQEPRKYDSGGTANQNKNKKQEKVQTNQQSNLKVPKNSGSGTDKSAFWCHICNVQCTGEFDLASHLWGKKHLSRLQDISDFQGSGSFF